MSGDNEYNRRVYQRMQEELAEFNTPQARYQQRLDSWWQSQRELEFEQDDFYEVGGFVRIPFADSVLSQEPARQGLARAVTNRMLDDKYRPRSFEELADESDSA